MAVERGSLRNFQATESLTVGLQISWTLEKVADLVHRI